MKFVVTAGPTREPIDPVRFISNRSSGKMGYAIAEAARDAGHEVMLISGPVCLTPPHEIETLRVETAEEMFQSLRRVLAECDVLVMCAAVSDYRIREIAPQKLAKSSESFALQLVPNRDILREISGDARCLIVGFAAETHDVERHALQKLHAKNCDLMVANNVSRSDAGIESDDNAVKILSREGVLAVLPRANKKKIARDLVKIFLERREKRLTKKT